MDNQIIKTHDIILQDESKYSPEEVFVAKRSAKLERAEAHSKGITIAELRAQHKLNMEQYIRKMDAIDAADAAADSTTLKDFGRMVMMELKYSCEMKGGKFQFPEGELLLKYKEIMRYMYGAPTESINSQKFIYLYGRYGNGKSLLIKTIYKTLSAIYRTKIQWKYFHIPTIVNKAIAENSIKPFDVLFNCQQHMILDEIGDQSEKRKIYGDDKIPIRELLLDKYDKWISNNGNGQKIIITSNLFPDRTMFYHAAMDTDTIISFYDEKLYNKMKENYNLIRFPNISYRDNNINSLM